MLKKTITYEDFNGDEVSEDFFFHLSKAELVELEMSHTGGLKAAIERIVAAEDNKGIIQEFKNIILSAYGKRSIDGKRFIKNEEVREEFQSTGAYSALFMELVSDTDAAIEFINGIVPAGLAEEAANVVAEQAPTPALVVAETPEIVTRHELETMAPEDFDKVMSDVAAGKTKVVD